jgi:adenine-specific DNA glycosylase
MIGVNPKLLEILEESTCFGIAPDDSVPECQQCDVRLQCKAKASGELVDLPDKKVVKEEKPKDTPKKAPKKTENSSSKKSTNKPKANKPKSTKTVSNTSGLPNFKEMAWEELEQLATDRNVEWKDYGNPQINRMRIIMALKKSY